MKKWVTSLVLIGIASIGKASVVTGISQAPGFGGNVDLTAGSYITWGYDADSLTDGFTNFKSGTTAAAVSNPNNASTRDYGYTFTFNDGNSPSTGTGVSSSGGLSGLLNTGPTITFSGIVSSTETRRLTLYVGGFHSAGSGRMDLTFDVTLTGGTADETGIPQTFIINKDTSDAVGFVDGFAVATYTVEFSSVTEPDVVIDISYSNLSGTRNWGLSGYTVETVSGGTPPPEAPTGLAATAGNGSVSLAWNDNTESNLTYSVYRSTNSGGYGGALTNGLVSSDYTDSTVVNFTTYYYVVTAVDTNSAESDPSDEVSATPADPGNQPPAFTSDPIVETNALEGEAYSAAIGDDASDPEADAMSFSKEDGPAWLSVAATGALSGIPGSTNTGLNVFTVQVTAAGGSDTAILQITVDTDTTPPAAPADLAATAGNNSVTLNWTDNAEADLAGYSVYRSTNSGSYGSALATNLTSSAYIDSTAVNGTTYYYVVTAVDDSSNSNESTPSGEVSATPDASALPLLVWLDASQGLGLDAGKVVTWTNLSSPGTFNAVQADSGKRPVVLTDEPLLPGKTVLYFDGSDDLLTLEGTVSNALFEGELTVFFVGRRREGGVTSGPEGIIGNYQPGSGYNQGWGLNALSSGAYGYRIGNGVNNQIETGWGGVGNFVIANIRYSDLGGDTGKMELFTSLTEESASKNNSPFLPDPSTVDIGIGGHCGWMSLTFNKFLECDIAEVRIYGGALSDAERQSVWDELSAKYTIVTKKIFDVEDFQPTGYDAPTNTTIQITFDSSMDVDSMTNMIVGQGGLDGYPEGGDWQRVSGEWTGSVSDSVLTFTPDQPFDAGALVMCEIPTNVLSAQGGSFNGTRRESLNSFVVDTGTIYSFERTVLDPMAVVSNEYVDDFGVTNVVEHHLPMVLHIPDTGESCPVVFWVHGGSFNGGNTGTLTNSAAFDGVMAEYFAEKLGIAVVGVSWRSTNSEGTFTKATSDVSMAIQYVMDNAGPLGIDTSRMGLYGGSAGTPMSSLLSQVDTNMICYIGFNGSYNLLTGYGSGGGAFETDVPSFEANSAIFNIRTNDSPPTLLLHGTDDSLISPQQSTEYEAAIVAAGGEAETLLYRDEQHAFYNEGKKMYHPTMVACSEFLSGVFGLGIYSPALEGYAQWANGYGIGAGTNDFDFDGLSNLYEYGLDGNPTNGLDQGTLPIFTKTGSGFLYIHPRRIDDESLVYAVETTTNLMSGAWANDGYTLTGTNVTGGVLDIVTNEVDTVENEKFIRLRIGQ